MAGAKRGELQVRAARVAGVEIPNNKRAETALTYVFGIGDTTAKKIMAETGLENKRVEPKRRSSPRPRRLIST